MSGRTILVMPLAHPAILLPTGLVAGVAALGAGLAIGVKTLVEARIAAAHREREHEKAAGQVWRAFEQEQSEQSAMIQNAEQAIRASEKTLAALHLAIAGSQARETNGAAPQTAHDYAAIGAERDPEKMDKMMADLKSLLDSLPAEFRETEGSSFPALLRQAQRLTTDWETGRKVRPGEITAFKDLVAGTLTEFAEDLQAREHQRKETAARIGQTLDTVLFYEQLVRQHEGLLPREFSTELASVSDQIARLASTRDFPLGLLELLEKKVADLRVAIDNEVIQLAQRDGLCESIARNLHEMGYKVLADFGAESTDGRREAVLRVPGGERIHITLHKNNQVGMQLFHERKKGKRGPLSAKENEHVKKQETRWCADFKELVRRLVAEGFPYEISAEDLIPEGAVKVVVVETPEDVLAQEAMQYDETPQ
ncbi:MAG: hypothetical protein NTZ09_16480, partial [Candidatus Hydrogenedentes bacterium]|nr:hypothetical protein [Candidatus Hydrogenedentota bacterium]